MKKIIIFIILASFLSCNNNQDTPKKRMQERLTKAKKAQEHKEKTFSKDANFKTATIAIEGMSCKINCATKIEKNLKNMDGVKTATVDFDNKKATVVFDSNSVVNTDFIKTITETNQKVADYKVTDISIK
jgi:Cu+-exporting ATPase